MYRKSNPFALALLNKKAENQNPFSHSWKIWKSYRNLHILYDIKNNKTFYKVLYIHSALFHLPSRCTIAERHNILYSNSNQLSTVSEKIRYYRHKHLLHQTDVANILEMDRTLYQDYEYNKRDYFPLETLEKLADFYHIPPESLMDEYHIFLYHDPGTEIKQFRKQYALTQEELGIKLDVWRSSVRAWEKGYKKMSRQNFDKFMELKKNIEFLP